RRRTVGRADIGGRGRRHRAGRRQDRGAEDAGGKADGQRLAGTVVVAIDRAWRIMMARHVVMVVDDGTSVMPAAARAGLGDAGKAKRRGRGDERRGDRTGERLADGTPD